MLRCRRWWRGRSERGAAAVEAGLLTALLSPLLVGVLAAGDALWERQRAGVYEPRVTQSDVVGVYTDCDQLLAAVKDSVLVNIDNVSRNTGIGVHDVVAEVVDFVPDRLGVDVRVSVRVPATGPGALVGDDHVVSTDLRLANVRLHVVSC